MHPEEYQRLYEKYIAGLCDEEEVRRLYEARDDFKMIIPPETDSEDEIEIRDRVLGQINDRLEDPQAKKPKRRAWWMIAAAIALIVAAGPAIYKYTRDQSKQQIAAQQEEVLPGTDKAVLTLSDGSTILLGENTNRNVLKDGETQLNISGSEGLSYEVIPGTGAASVPTVNMISIPRGGEYSVKLSDGTKVWLNSETVLKFQTDFTPSDRIVELAGEAYFEVATDASRPFKVLVNDTEIRVLGTRFNVNTHSHQAEILTTLVEGSVALKTQSDQLRLKPGFAANVSKAGKISTNTADVESAIAWKNGYFVFEDHTLTQIMEMVARWYNIEVIDTTRKNNRKFGGTFSRSKSIDELIKFLEELTQRSHFKREGRKIIIQD